MRGKAGSPNIVEAFSDEKLFGHYFQSPRRFKSPQATGSWDRWKIFLKAVYGIPIYGKNEKEVWRNCTDRPDMPKSAFDEFYAIVGRRGGKSSIVSLIAVYEAIFKDWSQYLSKGERATIFCMSTKKDQAQIVFRHCRALLHNYEHMITKEHNEMISLNNKVDIVTIPARFTGLRGYTVAAVILDEFAFFPTEDYANPAKEIIRSLRPAILPGAKLMGISTPYAKMGFLFDVFKKNYGKEKARILIWKATTQYMNPAYRLDKIDEEYEEDPISARTEYGAEFRDDVSTYLTEADIDLLVKEDVFSRAPDDDKRYFAFVDVSGARKDSFAYAIAHPENDFVVLDCVYEKTAPYDVNKEVSDCSDQLKYYSVFQVTGDKYSGDVYAQKFREHHIHYKFAENDKSELFLEFQRIANLRRVELLDNNRMKGQFVSLDRRAGRHGKDTVEKQSGGNDDLANAVAGATVLAYRRLLAHPSKEDLQRKAFRRFGKGPATSQFHGSWQHILENAEKEMKKSMKKKVTSKEETKNEESIP